MAEEGASSPPRESPDAPTDETGEVYEITQTDEVNAKLLQGFVGHLEADPDRFFMQKEDETTADDDADWD